MQHDPLNYVFTNVGISVKVTYSLFFECLAILLIFAARKTESDRIMAFAPLDCPQLAAMSVSSLVSFTGIDDLL